jgi:uncharacterized protein (TIGR03083 family)
MNSTQRRAVGERPAVPPVDLTRAAHAARGAAGQLVALLRTRPDPGAAAVGHWTARDVAAHVAGGAELYAELTRGPPSPAPTIEAITALNDQIIGTLAGQDLQALADRIEAAVAGLLAAAERHPGDPDVPWHAGLHLPLSSLLAVACGEYLIHGRDIARTAAIRWPVPADWARTVFLGLLPVVPHYLRAEHAQERPARYDIRLRGEHGARAVFIIEGGALTVGAPEAGRRADCYLSADPWAFLLVLYGRTGPLTPALAGQILAWGRRPWLAFTLPARFRKP